MRKCKCGGHVGFDMVKMGIVHTYPTCPAYEALDVDALMQQPEGSLALAVYAMQAKAEA